MLSSWRTGRPVTSCGRCTVCASQGVEWSSVSLASLARFKHFVGATPGRGGRLRSGATVNATLTAVCEFLPFCARTGVIEQAVAGQLSEPRWLRFTPPGFDAGESGQFRMVRARSGGGPWQRACWRWSAIGCRGGRIRPCPPTAGAATHAQRRRGSARYTASPRRRCNKRHGFRGAAARYGTSGGGRCRPCDTGGEAYGAVNCPGSQGYKKPKAGSAAAALEVFC
jgi:hypothetical protein